MSGFAITICSIADFSGLLLYIWSPKRAMNIYYFAVADIPWNTFLLYYKMVNTTSQECVTNFMKQYFWHLNEAWMIVGFWNKDYIPIARDKFKPWFILPSIILPPAAKIRCFSCESVGLWSNDIGNATPSRHSTQRESPAFATISSSSWITATTAVVPLLTATPSTKLIVTSYTTWYS